MQNTDHALKRDNRNGILFMRKEFIPFLLYLFINVLFVDKYAARITEWHAVLSLLYLCAGTGLFFCLRWVQKRDWNFKSLLFIGGLLYGVAMLSIQYAIDPLTIQVDRWSAIHYFLDNMFDGVYPYSAQTHLGGYGSPFPIWQIVHIPFYAIGNVGLSVFVGLALFLYVIARYDSNRTAFLALLLTIASPAINYEIVVRSDLITNFLCVFALCAWLRHRSIRIEEHLLGIAVLAGLCAATRLSAVIPIAFLYGYSFLQLPLRRQFVFILIAVGTWGLVFLPFLLWDSNQLLFFQYNPLLLQTRQGSPIVLLLFGAAAIGWTIYIKEHRQHFSLHAGALLTLLVVLTFTYNMLTSGNYHLFSSAYDITYLNMALPFYIHDIVAGLSSESVS